MLPTKWGEMFEMLISNLPTLVTKMFNRFFNIDCVPEGNGRHNQVECAGTLPMLSADLISLDLIEFNAPSTPHQQSSSIH